MDQVFNELSLSASLPDIHAAHKALLDIRKAFEQLASLGFSRQIRVSQDFANRHITSNCTFIEYLKKSSVGQEKTLRQWLLTQFSRSPYVEQLCEECGIAKLEEYRVQGECCKGLALAKYWGIPALSLTGDERFLPPHATIERSFLTEDAKEIQKESCPVGIICKETDIQYHKRTIEELLYTPLDCGKKLFAYAKQQLCHLVFSTEAEPQLQAILSGDPRISRIYNILKELQRAMKEAIKIGTAFNPQGYNYTPRESSSATQGKNGQKHTFSFIESDKQGKIKKSSFLCEAHMRITDGDRIYFYPEQNEQKVYIGHIGKHLPTKRFG